MGYTGMWILTRESVDYCTGCGDLTDYEGSESIRSRGATAKEALRFSRYDLSLDQFDGGVFEDVQEVPAGCEQWASVKVPVCGFVRTKGVIWRLYRQAQEVA
jgi:hypothetical protein